MFVKKHVPRNLEHVLLGFCHFWSVLGFQEDPFKDLFLIFLFGFKSDRYDLYLVCMGSMGGNEGGLSEDYAPRVEYYEIGVLSKT